MPQVRISLLVALALSLGLHAGLLALWTAMALPNHHRLSTFAAPLQISLQIAPIQEDSSHSGHVRAAHLNQPATESLVRSTKTRAKPADPLPSRAEERETTHIADAIPLAPAPEKKLASMPAPPPPSTEEWKLASTYTLKNSKRYRYNWAQQVRSMMGTAVEGPEQGLVRFHIEIAPDGKIAKADVLWSTSEKAEKLAVEAIRSLPPLPPTPTGKPLIFEKTIAFVSYETGWPPTYKNDCLPDPPSFHNAFVWDGSSTQRTSQENQESTTPSNAPPEAGCPADSAPDSIEAEDKDITRQFEKWGGGRLNGVD